MRRSLFGCGCGLLTNCAVKLCADCCTPNGWVCIFPGSDLGCAVVMPMCCGCGPCLPCCALVVVLVCVHARALAAILIRIVVRARASFCSIVAQKVQIHFVHRQCCACAARGLMRSYVVAGERDPQRDQVVGKQRGARHGGVLTPTDEAARSRSLKRPKRGALTIRQ